MKNTTNKVNKKLLQEVALKERKEVWNLVYKLKKFTNLESNFVLASQIAFLSGNKAIATDGHRVTVINHNLNIKGVVGEDMLKLKKADLMDKLEIADYVIEEESYNSILNNFKEDTILNFEFNVGTLKDIIKELCEATNINLKNKKSKPHIRFIKAEGKNYIMIRDFKQSNEWIAKEINIQSGKVKMDITLNLKYMMDVLSLYKKKDVIDIGYVDKLRPLMIKGENIENLILPFKLKDEVFMWKYIE